MRSKQPLVKATRPPASRISAIRSGMARTNSSGVKTAPLSGKGPSPPVLLPTLALLAYAVFFALGPVGVPLPGTAEERDQDRYSYDSHHYQHEQRRYRDAQGGPPLTLTGAAGRTRQPLCY